MIFNLKRPGFSRGAWTFVPASGSQQPDWAEEGADWMMAIPVSGTLTLTVGIVHADLCLIAGGKPGGDGDYDVQTKQGKGGNGGEVLNLTDVSLPAGDYAVTVGVSGSDTVIVGPNGETWTSHSGNGAAGGSGNGDPGAAGSFAWADADTLLNAGWCYGSGGGHGYILSNNYQEIDAGSGGSVGTASSDTTNGHGGTPSHGNGYAGLAGTGQGGGGGARIWTGSYYDNYSGGEGGSGNVLIRKHKEVTS